MTLSNIQCSINVTPKEKNVCKMLSAFVTVNIDRIFMDHGKDGYFKYMLVVLPSPMILGLKLPKFLYSSYYH